MNLKSLLAIKWICISLVVFFAFDAKSALPLANGFVAAEDFDIMKNFKNPALSLRLTTLDSELSYEDLTESEIKTLAPLMKTRKEHAKLIGLKSWTPGDQKLIEEERGRFFLLQGQFVDSDDKTVHFLEVYWADKLESKQYLLTSEEKQIPLSDYKVIFR
ncbi:MAG: hypothetical protein V4736_04400 [Bdellovibrionota bacterium]